MMAELYRNSSRHGRDRRAHEALAKVGLEHRSEFLPTRLSGGERQRAAIARALMGSPKVLLCDEPTGNLDTAASAALLDILEGLNADGITVILITHEPDVAARASRQARIVDGVFVDAQ